jgi:hypothetical protein
MTRILAICSLIVAVFAASSASANTKYPVSENSENKVQYIRHQGFNFQVSAHTYSDKPSPFQLVAQAYQGRYHVYGISSFASLLQDISSGKVTAALLIKAAIEAKDLPPEIERDLDYISGVKSQMNFR